MGVKLTAGDHAKTFRSGFSASYAFRLYAGGVTDPEPLTTPSSAALRAWRFWSQWSKNCTKAVHTTSYERHTLAHSRLDSLSKMARMSDVVIPFLAFGKSTVCHTKFGNFHQLPLWYRPFDHRSRWLA